MRGRTDGFERKRSEATAGSQTGKRLARVGVRVQVIQTPGNIRQVLDGFYKMLLVVEACSFEERHLSMTLDGNSQVVFLATS